MGSCSGLTGIATIVPALPGDGSLASVAVAEKDLKAGLKVTGLAGTVTAGAGQTCTPGVGVAKTGAKLSGIASCVSPPPSGAYPLNGKLSIKGATSVAAYIRVAGTDPAGPDAIDVSGMVTKGTFVGATVNGSLAFDPITKDPTPKSKDYVFDSAQVGTPCGHTGGAPIGLVYVGDGPSLLGTPTSGLKFDF